MAKKITLDPERNRQSSQPLKCLRPRCKINKLEHWMFFLKNGPTPATFSFIFCLFPSNIRTILQQINVKKCPSSIWHRDSKPRPLNRESPPITTRPGLPPKKHWMIEVKNYLGIVENRPSYSNDGQNIVNDMIVRRSLGSFQFINLYCIIESMLNVWWSVMNH